MPLLDPPLFFRQGCLLLLNGCTPAGHRWGAVENAGQLMVLRLQEIVRFYSCLFQDSAQSLFWQIARVIWNCRVAPGLRIEPDFVTACSMAIENKAKDFSFRMTFW
jgi:hypothetical protein